MLEEILPLEVSWRWSETRVWGTGWVRSPSSIDITHTGVIKAGAPGSILRMSLCHISYLTRSGWREFSQQFAEETNHITNRSLHVLRRNTLINFSGWGAAVRLLSHIRIRRACWRNHRWWVATHCHQMDGLAGPLIHTAAISLHGLCLLRAKLPKCLASSLNKCFSKLQECLFDKIPNYYIFQNASDVAWPWSYNTFSQGWSCPWCITQISCFISVVLAHPLGTEGRFMGREGRNENIQKVNKNT